MKNYFNHIVGQNHIKYNLDLSVGSALTGKETLPALIFSGPTGVGKTTFAQAIAKPLGRVLIEIKANEKAGEWTPNKFFEDVLSRVPDKCVILIDECHYLPASLWAFFTTFFHQDLSIREWKYDDGVTHVDMHKVSFIFASSLISKVPLDLKKGRIEKVEFSEYSAGEMEEIVKILLKGKIRATGEAIAAIAATCQGIPRMACERIKKAKQWASLNEGRDLTLKAWSELAKGVGIHAGGMSNGELTILRLLAERGACSLNMIASCTGMQRMTIQRDLESNLLRCQFIRIDGKRHITTKGLEVVKAIKG